MTRNPLLVATAVASVLVLGATAAAQIGVDRFFDEFSAEWVRNNPNQAVSNRYFAGEEQARLERELTPVDEAAQRARTERARRGLERLSGRSTHRRSGRPPQPHRRLRRDGTLCRQRRLQ